MSLLLFVRFIFALWMMSPMAFAVRLAKPNCQEKCGNVIIPFPFGIGEECSANSSFTINCQNTTNLPKAFLASLNPNLEVLNISLNRGTVTLNQQVQPIFNCSTEPRELSLGVSLLETPFNFSFYNTLAVVGCHNAVTLLENRTTVAGSCQPICREGINPTFSTDMSCNGISCCRTSLPVPLKKLNLIQKRTSADNSTNTSCGYTFLVNSTWLTNNYRNNSGFQEDIHPFDPSFVYAPVVLDWEFLSPSTTGVECYSFYRIRDTEFHRVCYCLHGFEGNPYLDEGCQDNCINTSGSYRCGKSRAKLAYIGIGSGLGAFFLLIGTWFLNKVIKKRIKAKRKQKFFKRNGGLLLQQQLSTTQNGVEKAKLFSSKELERATDRFNLNRILGRGGQGTVYKGMLSDGKIVAVKKSQEVDEDDLEAFINEVVILSQINHRNIVKLLGCCLETEVPLLVYEFIPNDTLFQHIHEPCDEFPLSWEIRLRIATEVASAVTYLHSAASAPIYHRDIKSTNILLDENYRAKVSDFGTSRSISLNQTHLTTKVIGTYGYLDPEYFQSSQFTEKSDVYSFGVVMVELLTGQKAISSIKSLDQGRSLATIFLESMEENILYDILDAHVLKEGKKHEIEAIAQLAKRCLHLNGKRRPTMKEVAMELERIQMLKQRSADQDNLIGAESHSIIEVPEVYDFESISASLRFDNVTTSSSDINPLLSGDP